jgi:excisionase family DNA binding protein
MGAESNYTWSRRYVMVEIDGVEYLTAEEACTQLAVKPATIYAYVSRGILKSYKQRVGRARLYRRADIEELRQIESGSQRSSEAGGGLSDETLPEAEAWIGEL